MQQDVRLAHELLKDDPRALAEFDLCHEDATLATVDFAAHLKAAGVWGQNPPLPRSPRLAWMAMRALLATRTMTPQEVLRVWGDGLAARLAAAPTNRPRLDMLAFLYAQVDDKAHLKQVGMRLDDFMAMLSAPEFADKQPGARLSPARPPAPPPGTSRCGRSCRCCRRPPS